MATSLHINYHKSNVVPINMNAHQTSLCLDMLGCNLDAFPQVHLGLPLSLHKLSATAFSPFLPKTDRYLAGWQAALLNSMGHVVLVNSILDSQLTYAMCMLSLPSGAIEQMD